MRRGYSLLELIVVITLVGIIAAVGGVRYSTVLNKYRVELACELVRSKITEARQLASVRGTSVTLTFLKNASTFTITGLENPSHPGQPYVVNIDTAAPGAKITENHTITFNGFGFPAAGVVLELKASNQFRYIHVNAQTGAATVALTP